uniref:Uncharacterized protein n=1 Tax=Oryza meridionalis TaxID=40149 RepID=A0A0E0CUU7_9ORYZ
MVMTELSAPIISFRAYASMKNLYGEN